MRIVIHQFPRPGAGRDPGSSPGCGEGHAPCDGPEIDMTPDGGFVEGPRPGLGAKLGRWVAGILALAVVVGVVALAFWMAVLLLPIAIAVGLIAYAAFRWRIGGFRF